MNKSGAHVLRSAKGGPGECRWVVAVLVGGEEEAPRSQRIILSFLRVPIQDVLLFPGQGAQVGWRPQKTSRAAPMFSDALRCSGLTRINTEGPEQD